MPPLESSKLRFLEDAANLLGRSSPSTTAHLLTAHTHILHDEFKSLNSHQIKHHCAGCGSLRARKSSKPVRVKPKKAPKASSGDSATVYKCGSCSQRAVIPRKRSGPRGPSKAASRGTTVKSTGPAVSSTPSTGPSTPVISSQQDLPATDSVAAPPEKTADNFNRKKRAKARKQGGLQALLAAKKSTQPSLDLLDFLQ